MSSDAPVLPPKEALESFYLPPGYDIELVASEPLVVDPVQIEFDAQGRMWVVEMNSYMPNIDGTGERVPTGKIAVLEDQNGDGQMDQRTVFLDSLVLPRSIKVLEDEVLVAAPPHLWTARDTDGDLKADERTLIRETYGTPKSNPEHNANGLMWGMDNWIHNADHDGRLHLEDSTFSHARTIDHGQWGISQDSYGRIYTNFNSDPLHVDLLDAHYYSRNPNMARRRGLYKNIVENETVWPVHPTPGVNRGYRPDLLRDDSTLSQFTSAGSPVVYRGDRLPDALQGDVFVSEPAGNLVRRFEVEKTSGGEFRAFNPYADVEAEFLTSTDERFRPVNFYSGPDGTLYVVDMYRGIIQHRVYITDYLEGQIRQRNLETPVGLGRIYRVVHESTERDDRPQLREASGETLVSHLSHPNGWWRDTAQRLLVERGDTSVAPALRDLFASTPDERVRLHALWTLDGLGALQPSTLTRALRDSSSEVQAAAIRIAEPWFESDSSSVRAAVMNRLTDDAPAVRRQLAASLGELPRDDRQTALTSVLSHHSSDPVVVDATISGLHEQELSFLSRLLNETDTTEEMSGRRQVVKWLTAAVLHRDTPTDRQQIFAWIGNDDRPRWERLGLLGGVEEFAPPARDDDEMQRMELPEKPEGLLAATTASDSLVQARARSLADRFRWPGKPVPDQPDVPPLTEAQKRQFERGKQEYLAMCATCHQADGTGQPDGAARLIGSEWVTEEPGLPARIILQGKEGDHLMPPMGRQLSNQEVAAILTYIRRAWGNRASAVDSTLVQKVRRETQGRRRAWTGGELQRLEENAE